MCSKDGAENDEKCPVKDRIRVLADEFKRLVKDCTNLVSDFGLVWKEHGRETRGRVLVAVECSNAQEKRHRGIAKPREALRIASPARGERGKVRGCTSLRGHVMRERLERGMATTVDHDLS